MKKGVKWLILVVLAAALSGCGSFDYDSITVATCNAFVEIVDKLEIFS